MGPRARRALRLAHRFYEEQRRIFETVAASRRSVRLTPQASPRGTVLFSYLLDPFVLPSGQPLPATHTNLWESWCIAQTFLERGYAVDVVSFANYAYVVRRRYDVLVSLRTNLEKLAVQVDEQCVKILHADVAHVLFHNAAEANRLLALQQRRGVTLPPRRHSPPNLAIEHADCATVLGNAFTLGTYDYAKKPLRRIHISAVALQPAPGEKDFDVARKRFLWLSSGGFVHKGLDLVLEAFAGLPELELMIAAPLEQEPDFVAAFDRELHLTPNISTIGWVDVASEAFAELARTCVATVYPSSSEGVSGGVVACLHVGLIPIVTREAGVDVDGFGTVLPAATVEEVRAAVLEVAQAPVEELRARTQAAWEFARENHTRERFAEDYRRAVDELVPAAAPEA